MNSRLLALLLWTAVGCKTSDPTPLPTAEAVTQLDRATQPPLYQLLYDDPAVPRARAEHQRVRILIWLRHLGLTEQQLVKLEELHKTAAEREQRLRDAEQRIVDETAAQEDEIYQRLWDSLSSGAAVDAPEMGDATEALKELRAGGERERQLISLRMEGLRSMLDAEAEFLRTLTPQQEALFVDSLFFLRHRLDPIGTPADFRLLVGSVYDPGQFDVLTRGAGEVAKERLNIGGLWSDDPQVEGHALHDARKEVLLFLALQQPGLTEAITAARALHNESSDSSAAPPDPANATPEPQP